MFDSGWLTQPQVVGRIVNGPGYYVISGNRNIRNSNLVIESDGTRYDKKVVVDGYSNVILRNIKAHKLEICGGVENIFLQDCEVRGQEIDDNNVPAKPAGGIEIRQARNVYLNNCVASHCGNWQATFDEDINGFRVGNGCSNITLDECVASYCSGDGFSIYGTNEGLRDVIVKNCVAEYNKQTGFWSKQATNVLFAFNTSRYHRPIGEHPSAYGAGMGFQYGPENIAFVGNHIHDCCFGIQSQSTSGMGTGKNCYIIGNFITNIHPDSRFPVDINNAWGNAAITLVSVANKYIAMNLLRDCYAGINVIDAERLIIENNILQKFTGNSINVGRQFQFTLRNNQFKERPLIRYGNTTYNGLNAFKGILTNMVYNKANSPTDINLALQYVDGLTDVENIFGVPLFQDIVNFIYKQNYYV